MRITIVAGARPNFMKITPIMHALDAVQPIQPSFRVRLVHAGQHWDKKMLSAP